MLWLACSGIVRVDLLLFFPRLLWCWLWCAVFRWNARSLQSEVTMRASVNKMTKPAGQVAISSHCSCVASPPFSKSSLIHLFQIRRLWAMFWKPIGCQWSRCQHRSSCLLPSFSHSLKNYGTFVVSNTMPLSLKALFSLSVIVTFSSLFCWSAAYFFR